MTATHEHQARMVPTWQIGLLAAIVMIALAVAASSDTVQVWTNPDRSDAVPPADVAGEGSTTPPATEPRESSPPGDIGRALEVVAIGAFALIIVLGAYAASQLRPSFGDWRWPRWALPRRRREEFAEALPDAVEPQVRVDADAARVSLSEGPARNAIVACWIQLEGDVAAAGLPRHAAETSSEYVERVVGESSVDVGPITELAALYREARFSIHDLDPEHRVLAAHALERVLAALDHHDQAVA